ncbi:MAG: fused DSP-PTPase phosphatase/NAD kinase-like protein [Candidatus Saccharicenans sp.]
MKTKPKNVRTPKNYQPSIFLLPLLLLFLVSSLPTCQESGPRPEHWARPIPLKGVPNLFQVSETLYRSAQPTAEGFHALEKMGLKTVINLRGDHDDRRDMAGTKLNYVAIPSKATEVHEGDLLKFLQLVTRPENSPYLVHCHHGADRTGLFVAVYRVVVQGWPKEEAIREMQKGGFGFHNTYTNIVKYLLEFNPEKFRQALRPGEVSRTTFFFPANELVTN